MAVVGRQPRALDFVRLKLRLLRNGFRGQPWRVVAFVFGILFGLWIGGLAALGLGTSGTVDVEIGFMVAVYTGSALVLGWALIPLLFFGVDETLDPARFALLPLRRGTLARGMLAAAFVGTPAMATLLGTAGLVAAAAIRYGAAAALTALAGVAAGLTLGVVASRAITSAFANMLRSRRVRDLAVVVIAVLASSIAPAQLLIIESVGGGDLTQAGRGAEILAWTPLGAPYALPFDVGAGRWAEAGVRVAITVAAIGLLLWWWSRTIEAAMLGTSGGGAPARVRRARGGPVSTLLIPLFRNKARPSAFAAIVTREVRFWWRDPRRRASMASILVTTAVVPFVFTLDNGGPARAGGLTLGFVVSMVGTLAGLLLANQFSFDGNAHAAHLLGHVPGRVEIRARATAVGLITLPVQVLVVGTVSVLAGIVDRLPSGLGLLAAAFGVSIGVAGVVSVVAAYPLPESTNPFATNTGGATARSMLALVALVATLALCAPVTIAAVALDSVTLGPWLVLALGLAYGGLAAWVGTLIVGDLLDRRGPEVLAAVTPRR